MKYIFFVFWIVVIVMGVTFAGLNSHKVTINYYVNEASIYIPLLLLFVLAIGVLLGMIALLPSLARSRRSNRSLRYRIKQTEQEVNNLRTIPIKEAH